MPHAKAQLDVLPKLTQHVLALFESELSEVRFPDVDREVLEALTEHVWDALAEVERLEAACQAARARMHGHIEALDGVAQRGLSYARIFAEAQPALAARMRELDLAQSRADEPSASKRGRGRKRANEEGSLFAGPDEGSGASAVALVQ
jgi:hypothetical protein